MELLAQPYVYGELGCVYDLADALGVAAGLHEYFRNSDIIQMAHYAQTVNVIGCIKTTKTDAFFDATALPLMLYRHHFGTIPVEVAATTPRPLSMWPPPGPPTARPSPSPSSTPITSPRQWN